MYTPSQACLCLPKDLANKQMSDVDVVGGRFSTILSREEQILPSRGSLQSFPYVVNI